MGRTSSMPPPAARGASAWTTRWRKPSASTASAGRERSSGTTGDAESSSGTRTWAPTRSAATSTTAAPTRCNIALLCSTVPFRRPARGPIGRRGANLEPASATGSDPYDAGMSTSEVSEIDLVDPEHYRDGLPHELFSELRARGAVHRHRAVQVLPDE